MCTNAPNVLLRNGYTMTPMVELCYVFGAGWSKEKYCSRCMAIRQYEEREGKLYCVRCGKEL